MRRQLLEEDFDEAPTEQGGTGTGSPLDGLDMTDPFEMTDGVEDQATGEGEWDPNSGYPQGEGEWDPNGQQPAYDDQQYPDQGQYEAEPQYDDQGYVPPPAPRRPQRPQLPPQLSETEKKFAKYGFYRLLVTQPFFDNEDPIAQEVEQEMRAFVQGRMNSLLGGDGGVEAPVGFHPDEVAALKVLAQSVIAQGAPKPRQRPPQAPPPPRRPPPQQPTRRPPVVAAPRPPARPQVAPRPQRPAAPPPPRRPPPQYRPPQLARRPPEPQRQQPRPQQPQQRRPPPQQRQAQPPQPRGRGGVPADESVVVENGRKVRIRYREAFPGEYGPKIEKIMLALPVGMHTRLPNGVQVLRGGPEEWSKIIRQDLTKQTSDRTGVPFPRNMTIISAEQAGNALENVRLAPGLASTIARGLNG